MGICYPLLKEIDVSIPISKQKGYNNEYGRYWTKPVLEINQRHYIICSQWFAGFWNKLNKWIKNQKKATFPVYVVPKSLSKKKVCPRCNNTTKNEFLIVTYNNGREEVINHLSTGRCEECGYNYISDSIYSSYTKNKKIENLNVQFVPITSLNR